jgi:hypothetical protein
MPFFSFYFHGSLYEQTNKIRKLTEKSGLDSKHLLHNVLEPILERELLYRGILTADKDYKAELISWIEVV